MTSEEKEFKSVLVQEDQKEEDEKKSKLSLFQKSKESKLLLANEKNKQLLKECSIAVNHLPEHAAQILTSRMGDLIITPQQSFLAYFEKAKPRFEGDSFIVKFVEIYSIYGERKLELVRKNKEKGRGNYSPEDFWKEFEVLFDGMPNSYKWVRKDTIFLRAKIFLINILRVLKFGRKLIFSI